MPFTTVKKGTEKYEERKRELLEKAERQAEEQEKEEGKTLVQMFGQGFLEEGRQSDRNCSREDRNI